MSRSESARLLVVRRESPDARCAFCHDTLGDQCTVCPGCRTVLHHECRRALVECPTLGCRESVFTLLPPGQRAPVRPGFRRALASLVRLHESARLAQPVEDDEEPDLARVPRAFLAEASTRPPSPREPVPVDPSVSVSPASDLTREERLRARFEEDRRRARRALEDAGLDPDALLDPGPPSLGRVLLEGLWHLVHIPLVPLFTVWVIGYFVLLFVPAAVARAVTRSERLPLQAEDGLLWLLDRIPHEVALATAGILMGAVPLFAAMVALGPGVAGIPMTVGAGGLFLLAFIPWARVVRDWSVAQAQRRQY